MLPRARVPVRIVQWLLVTLAVVSAALIVAINARTLIVWNVGDTGFTTSRDFSQVVVEPGSAAERAGLRTDDRLDYPAMSILSRYRATVSAEVFAGQTVDVAVTRHGVERQFSFRFDVLPRTYDRVVAMAVSAIVSVLLLVLAAIVLARRGSLDAFAFWLIAMGSGWTSLLGLEEFAAGTGSMVGIVVYGTLIGFGSLAVPWLGLRLLPPARVRLAAERTWVGFLAALTLMSAVFNVRQLLYGTLPPVAVQMLFSDDLLLAIFLPVLIAIVVVGLVRTRGIARARFNWFVAGTLFLLLGNVVFAFSIIVPSLSFSSAWSSGIQLFANLGMVAFAYPILRHDVLGVGFAVNRAVIYGVVTAVLVGVFAGTNWLIGLALKSTGLALPVDVLLAAAAGLSLNLVQRRVTLIVDRVLFRRRYSAARRLRRVARSLTHARNDDAIGEAVVVEPCEALDLYAAAFFVRNEGGGYDRNAAFGWPPESAETIDGNERMIMHLLGGDEAPVSMKDVPHANGLPHGAPRPRIAVPLWSRRELVGIAFYSAHRNGTLLDPEEIDAIERVTSAATAAFDRIAAAQLRSVLAELADSRAENARLAAQLDLARAGS